MATSSARCAASASAIDLAGLAIAGGLFIVPVFAAVQAWAGADRRARVIAGVNVLNAGCDGAEHRRGRAAAGLSAPTTPALFMLLGVAQPRRRLSPSARPCRRARFSDALSIIYRALFRIEVKGLENLHKAGPNVIIALNHVSFLDAGLAMSLRSRKPVFAIDVGIAQDVVGEAVPQAHRTRCRSIRCGRWRCAR